MRNFLCLLVVLMFYSCTQKIEVTKKTPASTFFPDPEIDFLNKKYFRGFEMTLDASTPSDHPLFTYLDCKKEGYFAVHYIPKSDSLRDYWQNRYFKENQYEYDDLQAGSKIISKLLKGKTDQYNIFAYVVGREYLESNNGCTLESVFLKINSTAKVYSYNEKTKKWTFQKEITGELLPQYADNKFFLENFPDLFNSDEKVDPTPKQISLKTIDGRWSSNCDFENSLNVIAVLDAVQFRVMSRFSMNADLKRTGTNKYEFYFTDFPPLIALPPEMQKWDNMDNTKPVGTLEIMDDNHLKLTWFGFYLKKTQRYIETENPFSKMGKTISLIKCPD